MIRKKRNSQHECGAIVYVQAQRRPLSLADYSRCSIMLDRTRETYWKSNEPLCDPSDNAGRLQCSASDFREPPLSGKSASLLTRPDESGGASNADRTSMANTLACACILASVIELSGKPHCSPHVEWWSRWSPNALTRPRQAPRRCHILRWINYAAFASLDRFGNCARSHRILLIVSFNFREEWSPKIHEDFGVSTFEKDFDE